MNFYTLAQVASFTEAKDWVLLGLVALVGTLIGAAWADICGKIRKIETRLEDKIAKDADGGYQRLARCEERIEELLRRHHKETT